ncbi:hypothetical protein BKA63DRAFT_232121 [Paraphoma chrysanthemicola]|nr:hypothetical protein BKA63DRAFT_232121 [Paraphoma chrysanthemicola]
MFMGTLTSGLHTSLLLGSLLQIIGLAVAGCSRTFAMSFVFHGVFQGVGHGLMFCPAVTMMAMEWRGKKWRMLASGIGGCGASTGGVGVCWDCAVYDWESGDGANVVDYV